MAVTTLHSFRTYESGQDLPVDFQFIEPENLIVTRGVVGDETQLVLGTDYTVDPHVPFATGTVRLAVAIDEGNEKVRILRRTPRNQTVVLNSAGALNPATIMAMLDKRALIDQELEDGIAVAGSYVHGNLGGGGLHAEVTDVANGFMTPGLRAAVLALVALDPPAGDHDHDDRYAQLGHGHPELEQLTETTGNTTVYVDPENGDDANPGTITEPWQTLGKARDYVHSLRIRHAVTIQIVGGAGVTLTGNFEFFPYLQAGENNAFLLIQGSAWIQVTGLSGPASGTFDSTSSYTHGMTGAGWTADELKGYHIEFLTGALAGQKVSIRGNTTDAIRAGIVNAAVNGAQFRIVRPAVKLVPSNTARYALSLSGGDTGQVQADSIEVEGGTRGVRIYRGGFLTNCRVADQTAFGVNFLNADQTVSLTRTVVRAASGVELATAVSGDGAQSFSNSGCVFIGPGGSTSSRVVQLRPVYQASHGSPSLPSFVSNAVSGIVEQGTKVFGGANASKTIIDECSHHGLLINAMQGGRFDNWEFYGKPGSAGTLVTLDQTGVSDAGAGNLVLFGNCILQPDTGGTAIRIGTGCPYTRVVLHSGTSISGGDYGAYVQAPHCSISLETGSEIIGAGVRGISGGVEATGLVVEIGRGTTSSAIDNNAEAVVFEASYCAFIAVGASSVQGNAGGGVEWGGASGHGVFRSHADLVMGANTAGDIRITPGGSWLDLDTDLRAETGPPAKLLKDDNYFNVAVEP